MSGGHRLAGVRQLLVDAPELIAEDVESGWLLATPLMLSIVTLAYADVETIRLGGATPAQRRAEVFDAYLLQALSRKLPDSRYAQAQTLARVRWLAWQLRRSNRSTYFIEEMQADWVGGWWPGHIL